MQTQIATDPRLLDRLRTAASRPMTPERRLKQRVSFIMGGLPEDSTVTRERVIAIITANAKA